MNFRKATRLGGFILSATFFFSCVGAVKEVDPTAYDITPVDRKMEEIPEACKTAYEMAIPRVAIVDFTNNTTFDAAKVLQAQESGSYSEATVGAAGVGVAPGAIGIVYGEATAGDYQSQLEMVTREVNAKLGESVAEGITAQLVEMGGAKVYTRRDLQKVIQEQQFQQSGLTDVNTLVQLGKLAGVKYIITGSVNNVNLKWVSAEYAKKGLSEHLGLVGAIAAAAIETQEGWNLTTDMTIKILDVETGEIVLAKNISGREVLGKTPQLTFDALIGGIKKAAMNAIADAKEDLSKYFKVRGYIIQTRTSPDKKSRYALINVGSKIGIQPGQEFYVYTFQVVVDPFKKTEECDMVKLPVTLEVTNQVQENKAWTVVKGDENQIMRVKIGQLVERKPVKEGIF
ncbi:CsgG/HfaB family protein [Persephonella sp.]